MRMLLRETLTCIVVLSLLLTTASSAMAENDETSLGWVNGSYPKFCQRYGLGKPLQGGLLRYEHAVGDSIVDVTLADWITILTIGVREEDGSLDRSNARLHQIVPNRKIGIWKGTFREAQTELASWIGRSHLPFESVFGKGMLFKLQPKTYFHEILGEKILVVVNSQEIVRNVQWLNVKNRHWESLGKLSQEEGKVSGTD